MNKQAEHTLINIQRARFKVNGIVQGVGFRPFIYNLANRFHLNGFVHNNSDGVLIDVEGGPDAIQAFRSALTAEAPPLAEIMSVQEETRTPTGAQRFEIKQSSDGRDNRTLIAPDMSICNDCLHELFDPRDRRYLYPFINCTNCGPRYTIIEKIPYDRPNTTMKPFTMCAKCRTEYKNPADRRFHAQPNACPECGPHIWLEDNKGHLLWEQQDDVLTGAVQQLVQGKIIAVKGLGGFHLAVDATNNEAVKRLRARKNREEKPLAMMVENAETARQLVRMGHDEEQWLNSPQRPILLLRKKAGAVAAESVAPGNERLGLMLPYTPLHYLIFHYLKSRKPQKTAVLVMTSANRSEEPIVMTNEDARVRLNNIPDALLMHNREIHVRADDSVAVKQNEKPVFFRRSRGYVPRPIAVEENGADVLAVGGELKNTIAVLKGRNAFLSHHIGDLENYSARQFFEDSIIHLQHILEAQPKALACDRHPGYFATRRALAQNTLPVFRIQHHHAHLTSVMAEHRLTGPVIGLILDGTGYGYDGTIWGGEILIGDYTQLQRYAWLEPMPLPGGDRAIKEPWRTAVSYLYSCYGAAMPALPFLEEHAIDPIVAMIQKHINCINTSSCGRLFDAVAAMSGGRQTIRYEAQAAIELMQSVDSLDVKPLDYTTASPVMPLQPVIRSLVNALKNGASLPLIAARFHRTLIDLLTEITLKAAQEHAIRTVVLSGGVFQNDILFKGLLEQLNNHSLNVHYNQQAPPNDGGVALGQAVTARVLMRKNLTEVHYNTQS